MYALDLFSGIGGFALGFHRAGIKTSAFCEIEEYPRRVLAKNFPGIPCYDDVRTLTRGRMEADGVRLPDIICGGFPCQDISLAGRGGGIDGARSGLWREYARLIDECRPRWVVAENSPALRTRGADRVLSDLEELGYTGVPLVVGAIHAGAPHRRQRVWLVAYANSAGGGRIADVAVDAARGRRGAAEARGACVRPEDGTAHADHAGTRGQTVAHPDLPGLEVLLDRESRQLSAALGASPWASEPDVGRVAYGVPSRVDRLKALGNAVVPQIPEAIGRIIVHLSAHGTPACPSRP